MRPAWRNYWIALALLIIAVPLPRLVADVGSRPLPRPLAEFSYELGTWRGRDEYLSDRARDVLGTPDVVLRSYVDPGGRPVELYVSYFAKQQRGEISHSPRNCLPGAGWQPLRSARVSYPLAASGGPRINEILYGKAGVRLLVFYWFQERGRILASEYLVKWYLMWDAVTRHRSDGALIRVSAPVLDSEAATRERCLTFMRQALPQLNDFLPG